MPQRVREARDDLCPVLVGAQPTLTERPAVLMGEDQRNIAHGVPTKALTAA